MKKTNKQFLVGLLILVRECCTKDEMQGAEGEGEGSVLTYVT